MRSDRTGRIRIAGASGDITDSDHVVWRLNRQTSYVPSPLLVGTDLYFLGHLSGIMTHVHAPSGKVLHGPFRLPGLGMIFASPVSAAGRIYVADRDGNTLVMQQGSPPKMVQLNPLEDRFAASPALVGKELYLRGHRFLYCISEE